MTDGAAVPLAYRTDGPADAPVLLLGNSIGTTGTVWDGVVPALAPEFRVVRYEHRGHGGSPAPPGPYSLGDLGRDVLALLDGLGVERADYAGTSLGGMVGMWLAVHAPDRIGRLALVCTTAHFPPAAQWTARALAVQAEGTGVLATAIGARWFTTAFRQAHPDVIARYAEALDEVDDAGYAGCCAAIGGMDLRASLGAIEAPTLVIAGADDPSTPPPHSEAIAAGIPGARLVVLPDAAHLAVVEQPEAVADLLRKHVTGGTP